VVVLGCGHRGIINTLKHAQKLTGMEFIHTVVGGAHFMGASEVQVELSIAELRENAESREWDSVTVPGCGMKPGWRRNLRESSSSIVLAQGLVYSGLSILEGFSGICRKLTVFVKSREH